MPLRRNSARSLLATYVVVALVVLVAELFGSPLAQVAGWFATPLLAEMILVATDPPRPRPVVLVLAALGLSALSDVIPDFLGEPAGFIVLLALLTGAQGCWVGALWGLRRDSLPYTRPRALIWYGLLFAVGVFAMHAGAGEWFWPIVAYGVLVTATAVLASALGLTAAFGGALLFVSAALAAMYRFTPGWDRPGLGFWIALTLLSAEAFLALGVARRWQRMPGGVEEVPGVGEVPGVEEGSGLRTDAGAGVGSAT